MTSDHLRWSRTALASSGSKVISQALMSYSARLNFNMTIDWPAVKKRSYDPVSIHTVLYNLLYNSLLFTPNHFSNKSGLSFNALFVLIKEIPLDINESKILTFLSLRLITSGRMMSLYWPISADLAQLTIFDSIKGMWASISMSCIPIFLHGDTSGPPTRLHQRYSGNRFIFTIIPFKFLWWL